jgi:hypothetical protein
LLAAGEAHSDVVNVDGAPIELDEFKCVEVTRSRMIRRVCFDEFSQIMVVDFSGKYRQFCRVGRSTAEAFLHVKSMAQYFSQLRRIHSCSR